MSLRLRFLRPGESFGFICAHDQVEKMLKVVAHHGGELRIEKDESGGVYAKVVKRGLPEKA